MNLTGKTFKWLIKIPFAEIETAESCLYEIVNIIDTYGCITKGDIIDLENRLIDDHNRCNPVHHIDKYREATYADFDKKITKRSRERLGIFVELEKPKRCYVGIYVD